MTERTGFPAPPTADLAGVRAAWAGAVTLVTVADGRDDIGATVSSFSPVSAEPPLVLVSLMSGSYPAELFSRPDEPVTRFAVTLLSAGQRVLAGRFAAAGRPAARLMLHDVPHRRGPDSGALIPEGSLAGRRIGTVVFALTSERARSRSSGKARPAAALFAFCGHAEVFTAINTVVKTRNLLIMSLYRTYLIANLREKPIVCTREQFASFC